MKKKTFLFVPVALMCISLSSCSNGSIEGIWQSNSYVDMSSNVSDAASASANVALEFGPESSGSGDVTLTALINITSGVVPTPEVVSTYEVDVNASATIKGKWSYESKDKDEVIINFDMSTLNVDVDPKGVAFRENIANGSQMPVTDSLTNVTVNLWKNKITAAMLKEVNRFSKLDDIEIKSDHGMRTLRLEIQNPEQTMTFREVYK